MLLVVMKAADDKTGAWMNQYWCYWLWWKLLMTRQVL